MRRSLRPAQFLRMIENRFVTSESTFIDMAIWDRCIDDQLGHTISDRDLSVWVGLDASIKHDSTAIVAVTWDQKAQHVRLVAHRVFQPTPEEPLDFEATIMRTLKDLHKRFWVRKVLYDPYQLVAIAQRSASRDGLPMEEFPQTPANLTAASQNLFDIIKGRNLVVYPDADIRFAISRTIATETGPRMAHFEREAGAQNRGSSRSRNGRIRCNPGTGRKRLHPRLQTLGVLSRRL